MENNENVLVYIIPQYFQKKEQLCVFNTFVEDNK